MTAHLVLGEHGMIGDARHTARIDAQGTLTHMVWNDGAQARLHLDEALYPRGISSIAVSDARLVTQSYRAGTTILDTYFSSRSGAVKLTDFIPVASQDVTPDGRGDVCRVVRFLTCTRGTLGGALFLDLDKESDIRPPEVDDLGVWRSRPGGVCVQVDGSSPIILEHDRLRMDFTLKAGEQAHLAISGQHAAQEPGFHGLAAARKALAQCDAYWRNADTAKT
ncbi:hypothetical protein HT136_24435 [Novosphingobium profundi]|uniref:hypothetical protein n=1 Tax=Novosphingobium profundi TaxID=1774954 RepID=UPI001BDABE74|nr:hypothetical protein [Novosphingobium profundi]MBT0671524.1 hypothetical protein [Novosphingobium profundi]